MREYLRSRRAIVRCSSDHFAANCFNRNLIAETRRAARRYSTYAKANCPWLDLIFCIGIRGTRRRHQSMRPEPHHLHDRNTLRAAVWHCGRRVSVKPANGKRYRRPRVSLHPLRVTRHRVGSARVAAAEVRSADARCRGSDRVPAEGPPAVFVQVARAAPEAAFRTR